MSIEQPQPQERLSPVDRKVRALISSALYLSQGSDNETSNYLTFQYWLGMWEGIEIDAKVKDLFLGLLSPNKHNPRAGKVADPDRVSKMIDYYDRISSTDRYTKQHPELEAKQRAYMLPDFAFTRYQRMIAEDMRYVSRAEGRLGRTDIEARYASYVRDFFITGKAPLFPECTPIIAVMQPYVDDSIAYIKGQKVLYGDKVDTAENLRKLATVWEMRNEGKLFLPATLNS